MKYIIMGLFSLLAVTTQAQVRGIVKDNTGEPVPGANVFWVNTGQGVTTKEDGSFSISKPSKSHMLVISFIGFQNDTVHVSKKNQELDITLREGVELNEVNVVSRRMGTMKLRSSVMNEEMISSAELSRAACCNLGESFVTNPSVDVSYSDAATGSQADQTARIVRNLCTDAHGEYPELSRCGISLWSGICPRSVDAKHTGFQRNLISEEWLRSHHGTD